MCSCPHVPRLKSGYACAIRETYTHTETEGQTLSLHSLTHTHMHTRTDMDAADKITAES